MGFFRRREETLNEQLLREAGLDQPQQAAPAPTPASSEQPFDDVLSGSGFARPPDFDAVTVVHAPGLAGDRARFVSLPDGDLIVDEETGDADLSPIADAIERTLRPPYRATASRQEGDQWGVTAQAIDVRQFAYPDADSLELVRRDGDIRLTADARDVDGSVSELETAGREQGEDYVVEASRIDGDFWEVTASSL